MLSLPTSQPLPDCMTQRAEQPLRRQIQLIRGHTSGGGKTVTGQEAKVEIQVGSDELRGQACLHIFWLPSHFFPFCSLSVLLLSCSSFSCLCLPSSCLFIFHMLFYPVLSPLSHPLPSTEGFSPLCPQLTLDQLCPGYFSFFSYGPWNGVAFSIIRCLPAVLETLLSYLPICPKSCSKISVDSVSPLLCCSGRC